MPGTKFYSSFTWINEVLAGAERYDIKEDGGAAFKSNMQIDLITTVTTPGSSVTAARMNNVEAGIDKLDSVLVDTIDIITTGGTSTAYTLTTNRGASTALRTGESFKVKFHTAAGATPTLNRDGLGAKSLKYMNGSSLKVAVGVTTIPTNFVSTVMYDGTDYIVLDVKTSTVGWLPFALPLHTQTTNGHIVNTTLAANGGSLAVPVFVWSQMLLESVTVQNNNTATQRTWGWDLYIQNFNTGIAGENTLDRIAACSANQTFTPSVISERTITAGSAPVYLLAGLYWLVIQNRHASNSFDVGSLATNANMITYMGQTKTTTNPNGATLDFVAATWTKQQFEFAMKLNGRVFGQATAF